MTTSAVPSYAGCRFPLSLRMVDELRAVHGIIVSHETSRQWTLQFGQELANQVRRRLRTAGDKWHMDEVVLTIAGAPSTYWTEVATGRDRDGLLVVTPQR